MRQLMARCAATYLGELKRNSDFMEILYGGGEFILDFFMAVGNESGMY
jgi:hypothetical protein